MAELVVEDTSRARSPRHQIVRQDHLDYPHAAVIDASGFRVALFRGETWEACDAAAMDWVERVHSSS